MQIGYSELETGDPPMGVASGKLLPLPAFEAIRPLFVGTLDCPSQTPFTLAVRTSDGRAIQAQGGVHVNDYSALFGHEYIEVEALGIGYPLYEELFPGRYAKYEAGFRKKS